MIVTIGYNFKGDFKFQKPTLLSAATVLAYINDFGMSASVMLPSSTNATTRAKPSSLRSIAKANPSSPRRVVIYLAERGVPSEDVEVIPATIAAPGAPAEAPGKPPGSVPLLALGDGTYDHESLAIIKYFEDLAESRGLPTLRGRTPEDRARVRETLGLAQEVTLALELAAVLGCVIFRSADRKPAECDYCQYARELFHIDLTDGHPQLRQLYAAFEVRPTAVVPEGVWQPQLTDMTKKRIEF